ncbi:MAG: Nif11 family protein [Pseudanabaena sp. RU_4_16]|nr:Nif11 family protein [Pseudanabaena sp. RU_4_16]
MLSCLVFTYFNYFAAPLRAECGFSQVRSEKELDNQLKACQSSTDAIALAQQCGVTLSEDDLQQAAMIAETIPGFSFEKLWFRGVGLIK